MTVDLDPDTYARWRATELGRVTERLEVELVHSLAGLRAGQRVLDIGTGDGTYAIEAARRGASVVGLDTSPAMLTAAQARAHAAGLQIDVRLGSAMALPFPDASFDRVLAVTVLCFVDDPARALAEMARVTKPGGRVVLGELHRWSLWAARRRLAAWLRGGPWRGVQFWSQGQLSTLAGTAGLHVGAVRGAVFYPPSAWAARVGARIDPWLGRLGAPGAAFLALAADRSPTL
jgi:SAM-dependent methyltransferase